MKDNDIYVYTKTNLVAQVLKVLAIMSLMIFTILVFATDYIDGEVKIIYVISAFCFSALIFAIGEIVQILHDIRNKAFFKQPSKTKK